MKYLTFIYSIFYVLALHGQQFSVEDVLSAPYCSNLTVSEDGTRIAWIAEERGVRKIFTAQLPDLQPVERYRTDDDDGQILGNLTFDHAAKLLYFIKGSSLNKHGEVANPASLVKYPEQILYSIDLESGVLDDLGTHSNFEISPDNTYLLLPKGKKLLKFNVSTEVAEPVISMRGDFSDIDFSSDGLSIVFTSNRGSHSFIGHYTFGEDRIRWLSPSVYKDMLPQWSPDGNQVAFIRAPGDHKGKLLDITSGVPFSIVVHDLLRDSSEVIWSSPSDDGGFAQYYPDEPFRWARSGKLIFYSEHEGWMKIYTINPDGSEVTAVHQEECEIEHSHLSTDENKLVYSANCRNLNDRDIYVYDLNTSETIEATHSDFIETDPLLMQDGSLVYRKATYNEMPAIVRNDKNIYPRSLPISYPKQHLVKPLQVIFKAEDGMEIHGQLFVKERITPKPGLLFMHGGPIRQMLPGFHYSSYYAFAYAMNQYLADHGYVVLSVNYRSGIGYGRDFRRASRQGPRGASEYQDIVAAARYLQSLSYVDAERIGLWGGSYGGLLTAQGLARNSDLFKAGVDFHGVHDWAWRADEFSEGGAWGITSDLMEKAFASSPVADVSSWESPVLLIHGDDDRNVMFGQTIDLVERLREKGVYYKILVLPDEVHGFYRWESWVRSYKATAAFFNEILK